MSRARDWTDNRTGQIHWFDVHGMATIRELEILSEIEATDIDDLLDGNLSSREVLYRLNKYSDLIPPAGLIKEKRRKENPSPEVCRICPAEDWQCEGRITKHHFVPRWIMLELSEYNQYAPRSICTIPICVGSHRFLHKRGNGASKSIAKYLSDDEKKLANHLIATLRQERPRIYALLAGGNNNSYEWQLTQDWRRGLFDIEGIGKESFPRWQIRSSSSL